MLFWLVIGVLLGVGALYLQRRGDIKLAWYDWVLLVIAVIFFLLAISNYYGSMEELEPRAATFLLLSFGLPGLILAAIVGIRTWRGRPKTVEAKA